MRFCVQVKNKPCVRRTSYMRLISWIHSRGSETILNTSIAGWAISLFLFVLKLKTCPMLKDLFGQRIVMFALLLSPLQRRVWFPALCVAALKQIDIKKSNSNFCSIIFIDLILSEYSETCTFLSILFNCRT
jgi:hypothetical protein